MAHRHRDVGGVPWYFAESAFYDPFRFRLAPALVSEHLDRFLYRWCHLETGGLSPRQRGIIVRLIPTTYKYQIDTKYQELRRSKL